VVVKVKFDIMKRTASAMGCDISFCKPGSPGHFHDRGLQAFEQWDEQEYTWVKTIADARCGSVGLYHHSASGESFAVKVMPKTSSRPNVKRQAKDERGGTFQFEDPLTEIGVMSHLSDLGVEDVLPAPRRFCTDEYHDYIILKHCDGGDLFDAVCGHGIPLEEEVLQRYMRQILQAVQRLHVANVAHRDISLENILIDDGGLRLIDLSQAVPIRESDDDDVPSQELRYFVAAGKDSYRAPEAIIPYGGELPIRVVCPSEGRGSTVTPVCHEGRSVDVLLPADATPGRVCAAQPCGYRAAPIDVFSCGACFHAMAFLSHDVRPSGDISNHIGRLNVHSRADAQLPEEALELLASMLHPCPNQRITAEDALKNKWFAKVF